MESRSGWGFWIIGTAWVVLFVLASLAFGAGGGLGLKPELDPVYLRWVERPGQYLGFWYSPIPPREPRDRTGANSFFRYRGLEVCVDPESDEVAVLTDFPAEPVVRFGFETSKLCTEIELEIPAEYPGSGSRVRLYRMVDGENQLAGEAIQEDAVGEARVVVSPADGVSGALMVEIECDRMETWVYPGPSGLRGSWLEFGRMDPARRANWSIRGSIGFADGTREALREDEVDYGRLILSRYDLSVEAQETGMSYLLKTGEHNNPYFVSYPEPFIARHPEAFMVDIDGKQITALNQIIEGHTPVAAMDDPTITRLSSELLRRTIEHYGGCRYNIGYILGCEQSYPDYFGSLGLGDFRPAFIDHYEKYAAIRGWDAPFDREELRPFAEKRAGASLAGLPAAWLLFREAALAERVATYMQVCLDADGTRPVFLPTHGNYFRALQRVRMGHAVGMLLGSVDGFETAQITIDEDEERLNILTLMHMGAYGAPVCAARLANKTLDPTASGGGRSFTPRMLRRLVYECVGLGVWQIGPLQWYINLVSGSWTISGTPAEAEAKAVFGELQAAGPLLTGMSRLQPRTGLLISEATWRNVGWNPRWTGFIHDALAAGWQVTIVGDEMVGGELAESMPVLISVDNGHLSKELVGRLAEYRSRGGSVVVWGWFAEFDELARPMSEADPLQGEGLVRLDDEPGEARVLTNRTHTRNGAFSVKYDYRAAPFEGIERAVVERFGESVVRPVAVEVSAGEVNSYVLSDGTSLAVVVVNMESHRAEVTVEGPTEAGRGATHWNMRVLAGGSGDGSSGGVGRDRLGLSLEPYGTALVWMYPGRDGVDEAELARSEVWAAEATLGLWRRLGVDTGSLEGMQRHAVAMVDAGEFGKARALAAMTLGSLGVRTEQALTAEGVPAVEVSVFDIEGNPVEWAEVSVRLVPGEFRRLALAGVSGGGYRLVLDEVTRPLMFDVERRVYRPVEGRVRALVQARAGDRAGAGLSLLSLLPAGASVRPALSWRPGASELMFASPEGIYNYAPCSIIENGVEAHFYCANKVPGEIDDYIYLTVRAEGVYQEKMEVLAPGSAGWDSRHVCDPAVVKGEFRYEGKEYGWAMFFLGEDYTASNELGVAFANELAGPWVKYDKNPLVGYAPNGYWGVGQPSVISLDRKGRLLLFYSRGDEAGTRTLMRELDFSDMGRPVVGEPLRVPEAGLTSRNGARVTLHNADFAYDPASDLVFVVRPRHPFDREMPGWISSELQVACVRAGELKTGGGWRVLGQINSSHSNCPRNHNSGILRTAYGHVPDRGSLTIIHTSSQTLGEFRPSLWSYSLYRTEGPLVAGAGMDGNVSR